MLICGCYNVTSTDVASYAGARIPVDLDINYQTWSNYLQDYHDKILIQNIRFGLTLSLEDPDKLTNTKYKVVFQQSISHR